ncbi:HipA protein [Oxalobacteraceae bacterium IMCC9480]|nr:HipA protein [Oxalobacteraceae bacterium IMCC9480]NDP58193.1 type II toxin-antitoxin system HipA family toxin [Oxalobacteraceae bacterium]
MGRRSHTGTLCTWLNGEFVGEWALPRHTDASFTYHAGWFASAAFRSLSLSLPAVESNPAVKGQAVNNYFDNLLPDSEVIRRRLQAKFKTTGTDAFALLAAVGRDCVGAVQLLPPGESPQGIDTIACTPLDAAGVERLLLQTVASPSGMAPDDEDDLRLSIAGAQEKTALIRHDGRWCRPLGSTPTTHIFKLPPGLVGNRRADMTTSVENEWLCSRIMAAYGLPTAHCEMATFGVTKALIVERFDRRLASADTHWLRLPQEDFCQATGTPSSQKYEADGGPGMMRIAAILANSSQRDDDLRRFLSTQIVFWMLRATDGHAKNFSLFLQAGDRYRLTPLYDVLSAWPVIGHGANRIALQKANMAMAWLGENRHYHAHAMQRRHLVATVLKCGYGASPETLVDELLAQTAGVIDRVTGELPEDFPAALADAIFEGLRSSARQLAQRD